MGFFRASAGASLITAAVLAFHPVFAFARVPAEIIRSAEVADDKRDDERCKRPGDGRVKPVTDTRDAAARAATRPKRDDERRTGCEERRKPKPRVFVGIDAPELPGG
jgi:hypothetical protein